MQPRWRSGQRLPAWQRLSSAAPAVRKLCWVRLKPLAILQLRSAYESWFPDFMDGETQHRCRVIQGVQTMPMAPGDIEDMIKSGIPGAKVIYPGSRR